MLEEKQFMSEVTCKKENSLCQRLHARRKTVYVRLYARRKTVYVRGYMQEGIQLLMGKK